MLFSVHDESKLKTHRVYMFVLTFFFLWCPAGDSLHRRGLRSRRLPSSPLQGIVCLLFVIYLLSKKKKRNLIFAVFLCASLTNLKLSWETDFINER